MTAQEEVGSSGVKTTAGVAQASTAAATGHPSGTERNSRLLSFLSLRYCAVPRASFRLCLVTTLVKNVLYRFSFASIARPLFKGIRMRVRRTLRYHIRAPFRFIIALCGAFHVTCAVVNTGRVPHGFLQIYGHLGRRRAQRWRDHRGNEILRFLRRRHVYS